MSAPALVVTDNLAVAAARILTEAHPSTLVLAGGNTPRPIYSHLATVDHNWPQTKLFFTDERCVPYDHPDSNYGMVRATLLKQVQAEAYPFPPDCDAFGYELVLREIFKDEDAPLFDLAFMGLGADGHTASLFPGDAALNETQKWVARVLRSDHSRLTLTVPALNGVAHAVYLVAGADKREALARVLDGEDLPPNRIHPARTTIIADPAAAP